MSLDTSISIGDLIGYLQTPWGKIILRGFGIFIVSELGVRMGLMQFMLVFKKHLHINKKKFIAKYSSFGFNVLASLFSSWLINYKSAFIVALFDSWWPIVVSFVFHFLWVTVLEKKLKKLAD